MNELMYITIKYITMYFKATTRTEHKMNIYLIAGCQAISFARGRKKKLHKSSNDSIQIRNSITTWIIKKLFMIKQYFLKVENEE